MAERRMFAKTIIDSDAFLSMPSSSQALYFHLSMRADDEGFVNNPKTIIRATNSSDDDFNILIARNFILNFESGVIVIKHWKIHNYIRKDRLQETKYEDEKSLIEVKDNGAYSFSENLCQTYVSQASDTCQPTDSIGKVRLGKVRLGKDRKDICPSDKPDYQSIQEEFNTVCISLPSIRAMTDKRKRAVRSFLKQYSLDELTELFEKTEASDFLTGRTDKPWTGCGFDWILNTGNVQKILEGNYDNKEKRGSGNPFIDMIYEEGEYPYE